MFHPRCFGSAYTKGHLAESWALRFLKKQGLTCLARNYRCRMGEIDLIMRHRQTLIFVEVRCRGIHSHATASESIDVRKQRRIQGTAQHYLKSQAYRDAQGVPFLHRFRALWGCFKQPWRVMDYRFDVVSLHHDGHVLTETEWIRNAF